MLLFASALYKVLQALAAGLPLVAGVVICSLEISGKPPALLPTHQVHFLPYAENDKPIADPLWMDTVNVPYGGSVDVIMDFTDAVIRGMSVFHCHLLNHEDKGMMAKVLFE